MSNFFTETIQHDPRYHSPARCHDLALLEPVTRRKVLAIVGDAAAHGVTLLCYETYRSPARQQELFRQGATKLQKVGCHGYGLAADFTLVDHNGQPTWSGDFSIIGKLAHAHGLIWGGDWKSFPDYGHVQRVAVRDQGRLFRGEFWPSEEYDPYA